MCSKWCAMLAIACVSTFFLMSCAQVENQTGRLLESAGTALYPDGPQHADSTDSDYTGPAGDSFAEQRSESRSFGAEVENSAGQVLDNAGSVVRHTEKKLFVEDEEQRKQGVTAVERSAGRVLDNAGSVVRDSAARLWRPSASSDAHTLQDYEGSGSGVSEQDLMQ